MAEKEVKDNENCGFTELWMEQRRKRNRRKFYVIWACVLLIMAIAFVLACWRGTEMLCEHQDRGCVQQYSDALINLVKEHKRLGKYILSRKEQDGFSKDRFDMLNMQAIAIQKMIIIVRRLQEEDMPKEVKNFLLSLH